MIQKDTAEKFTIAYLSKLGLKPARDNRQFWNNIHDKYGKQVFNELNNAMTISGAGVDRNLYCLKNRSIELSIDFSKYSADLYRQFFEWFLQNISFEPVSILDLGCDNGIVTCFFALACPNAKVIGIDVCENGIKCAEQLRSKLGLGNVAFKVARIQDIDRIFSDQSFSMITSIRTLHEVVGLPEPPEHVWSLEALEKSDLEESENENLNKLLRDIKNRLLPDGIFISWERLSLEGCYLYIRELEKSGLFLNGELSKKIKFLEIGNEQTMPVIAAETKGNSQNLIEKALNIYSNKSLKTLQINDRFEDADAEVRYNNCKEKDLLYGCQIDYTKEKGNKSRTELWKCGTHILFYQYSNVGYRLLIVSDETHYNELLERVEQIKNVNLEAGNTVKAYGSLDERDKLD